MPLHASTLMNTAAYALKRRALRPSEIAHRHARAFGFGPGMRLQFEDERTLRYQAQEVLWAEGVFDAAGIRDEVATWSPLVPNGLDWRATLLIELPDAAQRARELPGLSRAAHRLELRVGEECIGACANEDLPCRHLERPSAVHFLRFALTRAMRRALRAGEGASLHCLHPAYPWSQAMPCALIDRLCADLVPSLAADERLPPRSARLHAA